MEQALPPDILLVHYLDDFLLVHHDKGGLRQHTDGAVTALERGWGGVIVSPKRVLEPSTRLVFLGKWLDLLERRVWSHEVAHLQMLVGGLVTEATHAVLFGIPALVGAPPQSSVPFRGGSLLLAQRGSGWAYPSGSVGVPGGFCKWWRQSHGPKNRPLSHPMRPAGAVPHNPVGNHPLVSSPGGVVPRVYGENE